MRYPSRLANCVLALTCLCLTCGCASQPSTPAPCPSRAVFPAELNPPDLPTKETILACQLEVEAGTLGKGCATLHSQVNSSLSIEVGRSTGH
jgi:hypothetical protein